MAAEQYCSYCKNRCPLSHPKCDNFKSPEAMAKRAADALRAESLCHMCDRRCPLDALGCSLGETIYAIKRKKQDAPPKGARGEAK